MQFVKTGCYYSDFSFDIFFLFSAGNYDVIQEPVNISNIAKKHVPFYMFIDEETENYMKNKSVLNSSKMVGLWRIIVVRNVPYADARRNGKVEHVKSGFYIHVNLVKHIR